MTHVKSFLLLVAIAAMIVVANTNVCLPLVFQMFCKFKNHGQWRFPKVRYFWCEGGDDRYYDDES